MLVVISDLHFQDTLNDVIDGQIGRIDRNVPVEAFRLIFEELLTAARVDRAKEVVIVLAGDIFEITRSQKWLSGDIRPYGGDPPEKWGPIAEGILSDIVESNSETFVVFRALASEGVLKSKEGGVLARCDVKDLKFVYLPGNHDRPVNLYGPLRARVRELFCIGDSVERFDNACSFERYGVLVRHGHEYDPFNFAVDTSKSHYGPEDYGKAPLGDYVTTDVAARIAYEYRVKYREGFFEGPDAEVHRSVYTKLLEFDDLRPAHEIMNFLGSEIGRKTRAEELLTPVLVSVLGRALKDRFLVDWMKRLNRPGLELKDLLRSGVTRKLLLFLLRSFPGLATGLIPVIAGASVEKDAPWEYAMKENMLDSPGYRYVVAGHTHNPGVEFLRKRGSDGREQFFFDTGTWRQQIRKCRDGESFARAKALTYVVFYAKDEDPPHGEEYRRFTKGLSFDYWSGFTKKELDQGR